MPGSAGGVPLCKAPTALDVPHKARVPVLLAAVLPPVPDQCSARTSWSSLTRSGPDSAGKVADLTESDACLQERFPNIAHGKHLMPYIP